MEKEPLNEDLPMFGYVIKKYVLYKPKKMGPIGHYIRLSYVLIIFFF